MILSLHVYAESDGERILKIGQHLPKLWAIKYRVVFFYETPCIFGMSGSAVERYEINL